MLHHHRTSSDHHFSEIQADLRLFNVFSTWKNIKKSSKSLIKKLWKHNRDLFFQKHGFFSTLKMETSSRCFSGWSWTCDCSLSHPKKNSLWPDVSSPTKPSSVLIGEQWLCSVGSMCLFSAWLRWCLWSQNSWWTAGEQLSGLGTLSCHVRPRMSQWVWKISASC